MINLILADNMAKGEQVMLHYKLDPEECAVITEASHLAHVTLNTNETIYVHATTDSELLAELVHEIPRKAEVNIKVVNT